MNKQEKQIYDKYQMSTYYRLEQCYDKLSNYNQQIYDYIVDECTANNGYDLRIIAYNSFTFTMGYMILEGKDKYFVFHTPHSARKIKVD